MILIESVNYRVPKSPEFLLYDFYVLAYIRTLIYNQSQTGFSGKFSQPENLQADIEHAVTELFPHLKKHLSDVLFLCICAELRHMAEFSDALHARLRPRQVDILMRAFDEEYEKLQNSWKPLQEVEYRKYSESRHAYKKAWKAATYTMKQHGIGPLEFVAAAKKAFDDPIDWQDDYGGKAWIIICDAWLRLYEAKNFNMIAVSIDHIYDLQHNSGFALNKVSPYKQSWVRKALDHKRDAKNIRELVPHCSNDMQKLALQALRAAGAPEISK